MVRKNWHRFAFGRAPRGSLRKSRQGVVLLSTLLSLMVLIGVVTLTQSLALANTKVTKRLTAAHQEALAQDAARALIRPAVAEAMVRFEEAEAARFFDTPHLVEFAGAQVEIVVSVVEESASGQPVRVAYNAVMY